MTGSAARSGAVALAAALAAVPAGGCADAPPASPWLVRDSAGVEVVTTPAATLAAAPVWSLDPVPLVDLGTVTGGGPTEFYQVQDVRFLPGDRIVVANMGSEELRFFSLTGEYLHSAGRPGNGPREFKRLAMVRTRADSLVTYDGGNDRISVRGPWGEFGRSFRLDWISGFLLPEDVVRGQRILAITGRHMTELEGTGVLVDTALVSVYDMEGHLVDSVARLPLSTRFVSRTGNMQTTLGAPFVAWAALAGVGDGFCYTFGPVHEVRCFGLDGSLRRIARVDEPRRAVTTEDVEAFWEDARAASDPASFKSYYVRFRDTMPFPDFASAFDRILPDDRGRMWVRRYVPFGDAPHVWWVFGDGGVVGRLDVPGSLRVFDVRDGTVAGVWRDDLGVEHVRLYRLRDDGALSR